MLQLTYTLSLAAVVSFSFIEITASDLQYYYYYDAGDLRPTDYELFRQQELDQNEWKRKNAQIAIESLGMDPKVDPELYEEMYYARSSGMEDTGTYRLSFASDTVETTLRALRELMSKYNDIVLTLFFSFFSFERHFYCSENPIEKCYQNCGCFNKKNGLLKHICRHPENEATGRYFLFTRANKHKPVELFLENLQHLDGNQPLAIVLHGFMEESTGDDFVQIKNELLATRDYDQVVLVDYQYAVRSMDYVRALANSELLGRKLALLLEKAAQQRTLRLNKVYIIGFSMGCQVAHFASKWLRDKTGARPGRITALDPPAVLIDGRANVQIDTNDADFVDVIHSSAGFMRHLPLSSVLFQRVGTASAVGHVDFFPNGGGFQPQCGIGSKISCKHRAALSYFISSFRTCTFETKSCSSVNPFRKYAYCIGGSVSSGSRMGYHAIRHQGRGSQVLTTTAYTPHC